MGRRAANHDMLLGLCLVVLLLALGKPEANAAYRLTFQNGTSVAVQSYEDQGDAIRYPRYGGMVTVPKSNLSSIQEVPSAPPTQVPSAAMPPPPLIPPHINPTRSGQSVEMSPPTPLRQIPVPAKPKSPAPVDFTAGARSVMGSFASLFFVVVLAAGGFVILIRLVPMIGGRGKEDAALPYEKRSALLTAAERSFHGVLCQVVDSQYAILAKVRLGDLLEIPWGTSKFRTHLSRINRKHVDFVLCDPESFAPLLAIELDDASHDRADRQARDAFVDAALGAAGLPILHVSVQHAYAPAEVRALIEDRLNGRVTLGAGVGVRP